MSDYERQWLKALVVDFDRLALHAPFADLPLFSYDPGMEALLVRHRRARRPQHRAA